MTHRVSGEWTKQRARRLAAAVTLGLLASACGGSTADPTLAQSGGQASTTSPSAPASAPSSTPDATPATPAASPASPATSPATTPAAAPATTSGGAATASGFSWTKPAGFDAALQAAIAQQPAFMGGYGGSVGNPFPAMDGTAQFPSLQITRPDAIVLDQFFGRWAYRFYVDSASRHSNGLRAEFTGEGKYTYQAGDAARYSFGVYFDDAYLDSSWDQWNMFAQFHSPDFAAWGLYTAGGYLMMGPPGAASDSLRVPLPARGVWHEFVWTIRWSPDSSGHATLAIDGVTAFDYSGPTMHAGEPYYYPKFGSYLANNPYTQVTYETPWTIEAI